MEEPTRFEKVAPYLKHPLVLIGLGLLLFFGIHRQLIDSGIIPPLDPESGSTVVQAILRYGFWIAMAVVVLGFALQFYKRHLAAAPSVDVEAIIDMLEASHRKQLAALDQQYQGEVDDWKAQAKSAVEALNKLGGQKDAPPGIDRALALLAQGDTQSAEAVFQEIASRREPDIQEAAAAYRHLGALVFWGDTQKALAAYRRATELDPRSADGWNQLGSLLVRVGQLDDAEKAYREVEFLGSAANDKGLLAVAYGNLGNVYRIRGELDQAEAMYGKSLALFQELGAAPQIEQIKGWLARLK